MFASLGKDQVRVKRAEAGSVQFRVQTFVCYWSNRLKPKKPLINETTPWSALAWQRFGPTDLSGSTWLNASR